jgi:hypothetical protein
MNTQLSQNEHLLYRTLLALGIIVLAAALRIAPHPWNFTPVGAMALFSGAVIRDRRLAFFFPLLALFAGDIFIGFHKLMPVVSSASPSASGCAITAPFHASAPQPFSAPFSFSSSPILPSGLLASPIRVRAPACSLATQQEFRSSGTPLRATAYTPHCFSAGSHSPSAFIRLSASRLSKRPKRSPSHRRALVPVRRDAIILAPSWRNQLQNRRPLLPKCSRNTSPSSDWKSTSSF